jgi:hypothetical protein
MINNQTLKFILPLVTTRVPKFYLRENFIGTFIGDILRPEFDGNLLLVYKYPYTKEFAKFELGIEEHPNYFTTYDYDEQELIVFVFNISDFEEDVANIIEGYYSEISPESKLKISKFWIDHSGSYLTENILNKEGSTINNYWYRICQNREDYCREDEYWYIPNLKEEVLDITKI